MTEGLAYIHRHDDSAICFDRSCPEYTGPMDGWRPAEHEAIVASCGVDLTREPALLIRKLLAERYGADMVTNELVALTTAQALANIAAGQSEFEGDMTRWQPTGVRNASPAGANPRWWETAIAGTCSHGGHGWDGDTCSDAPAEPEPVRPFVGLPYAEAGVDSIGYYLACPMCGARCRGPAKPMTEDDATKGATRNYGEHFAGEHSNIALHAPEVCHCGGKVRYGRCRECGAEWVRREGDWLHCLCDNTPDASGFQTCLADGTPVEPTADGPWDESSYLCLDCGRVINYDTLAVIARVALPEGGVQ